MRLSELVSQLSPTTYTQIALVIFLVTFAGIVLHACARGNRELFEHARHLPLDDHRDGE